MKKLFFLLVIMFSISFCTVELSEIEYVSGEIIDLDPNLDDSNKIPKEKYSVQYFSSEDRNTPILSRVEKRIQHDFNSLVNNEFSSIDLGARWIGDFQFEDKEYTFDILSDKHIRILIDGEEVFTNYESSARLSKKERRIRRRMKRKKQRVIVEYNLQDSTSTDPVDNLIDPTDDIVAILPVLDSIDTNVPIVEEEAETPTVEVDWLPSDEVIEEEQDSTDVDQETTICITNGGMAGDTGLKTWCWSDIVLPDYSGSKGEDFSNGQLMIDSECYEKQVTIKNGRLNFDIDPSTPDTKNWCSRDFNMRAEIHTEQWPVKHSLGTEEWFGWDYKFGDDYEIDQNNEWAFFQVHNGVGGTIPHTELFILNKDQFNGHDAGEISVVSNGNYHHVGITPKAGQTLNIVVHAVWGKASNGLLQIWIDGEKVYDKQERTVLDGYPYGGNAKWGIYKWSWDGESGVQKSLDQGISHLETSMGPLRMITRRPGDEDYLKDSYSEVMPR